MNPSTLHTPHSTRIASPSTGQNRLVSPPHFPHYPLSVAPMMDRTDRHFRYFMRQITRRTLLYTEMVTSAAILYGVYKEQDKEKRDRNQERLLGFSPEEKPLVLQVGGDDPHDLAICARIAEELGYDEINLNVGCPSDRVQSGNFGACLMAQPQKVAACIESMMTATSIPVTVKHRIGIDERDRYEDMVDFVQTVATVGCQRFSVHARKAWLKGLSPKDNRTIPPLRYEDVHRLKREFPHLWIEINGGFTTLEQVHAQLQLVDAVMIGRAAYDNPYLYAQADWEFWSNDGEMGNGTVSPDDKGKGNQGNHKGIDWPVRSPDRHQIVNQMLPYIEQWTSQGLKLHKITRHMLQLFTHQPGSRAWKRHLTENSCREGAGVEVVEQALAMVPR
ncbi:MAG: tRNA dihydrouridine(20/20a) synthase DusA [Merismopedia sp. SIO2A8]|nr:tRNA dihydrouridine(20/20a) synthase DusA [Symploca sp. SIO2B6]NET49364.1 tRNA dihydrouridine(20/20a) synthase DusA [Merismopedia sp. SIO2A8]